MHLDLNTSRTQQSHFNGIFSRWFSCFSFSPSLPVRRPGKTGPSVDNLIRWSTCSGNGRHCSEIEILFMVKNDLSPPVVQSGKVGCVLQWIRREPSCICRIDNTISLASKLLTGPSKSLQYLPLISQVILHATALFACLAYPHQSKHFEDSFLH